MKNILITGANSYIGTSFEQWVRKYPDKYLVNTIDLKDSTWKEKSFLNFDIVFHVAGIAHVSTNRRKKDIYYEINQNLSIETAKKAKAEGVKQFIFMSSIIVYGDSSSKKMMINSDTLPKPSNFYGDSKLKAEEGIMSLRDDEFKVVILKPPMIYGKRSKGNYPKLAKAAKKLPLFPDIDNERSMLHIDNLCEFIKIMIDQEEVGFFFPQNKEYVKTSEMVKLIAEIHGKKIRLTRVFNPLLKFLGTRIKFINRIFGNLVYEKSMSNYEKANYQIRDFRESIMLTESGD